MEGNTLIVHSLRQPCATCCLNQDGTALLASSSGFMVVDALTGIEKVAFRYQWQLSPVLMARINKKQHKYLLQNRDGLIVIIKATAERIDIVSQYSIDMLGFTKLSLPFLVYQNNGEIRSEEPEDFMAVSESVRLIKRNIDKGAELKNYELDDGQFGDVTAMLRYFVEDQEYILVASEGAHLKKIKIPIKKAKDIQIVISEELTLKTEKQIKYIPCIEPLNNFRAMVTLRQDKIHIVTLHSKLAFQHTLDLNYVRMAKSINRKEEIVGIIGKQNVGVMVKGTVKKMEKIQTKFVIDMDVSLQGVIGVTEEGRLFFLPLE